MGRVLKKITGIILIGLLIVLVLLVIDSILNKGKNVHDFVYDITDGKVQMDLEELDEWKLVVTKDASSTEYAAEDLKESWDGLVGGLLSKLDGVLGNEVHYDIDDATIFDKRYEIVSGNLQLDFPQGEVQRIDVEVGGCDFSLVQGGTEVFTIDAIDIERIQCYAENGTLYIKASAKIKTGNDEERHIYLKMPEGKLLEEASFEIGAGSMNLGDMSAQKVTVEVGAGRVETGKLLAKEVELTVGLGDMLADVETEMLEAEVGVGNLQLDGKVLKEMSVECSVGNADIYLANAYSDFNYHVTCGAGKVVVGEESYSGAALEEKVDNKAEGEMEVDCAAGNVTITFVK